MTKLEKALLSEGLTGCLEELCNYEFDPDISNANVYLNSVSCRIQFLMQSLDIPLFTPRTYLSDE